MLHYNILFFNHVAQFGDRSLWLHSGDTGAIHICEVQADGSQQDKWCIYLYRSLW